MSLTKASFSMIEGSVTNVMDFGAVGDGNADDSNAIQAAIDSLTAKKGGYTIFFPPGLYKITKTLVITAKRISFVGPTLTGSNSAAIIKAGTYANLDFIDAGSSIVDTFSMFNLQLQGDGTAGSGSGITLGSATTFVADCRIENCWFNQMPYAALKMVNVGGYHINNNGFEQSTYAIYFQYTSGVTNSNTVIENNRFYSNKTSIFAAYGQHQIIVGNLFDNCGDADDITGAIVLSTSNEEIRGWLISANLFRANYNDIVLLGVASKSSHVGVTVNSVIGNHSDFCQRHFLYASSPDGVLISNNHINDPCQQTDNTFAAIDLTSAKNITVDGNVVQYAGAVRPKFALYTGAATLNIKIGQNNFSAATAATSLTSGSYSYLVAGEESTFTPTMFGSSVAGLTTYTNQIGSYQRNGQWVHFSMRITWTAATGTGFLRIGNLPYNANSTANLFHSCVIGYASLSASDTTTLMAYIPPNESFIAINKYAAGVTTALNVENSGDIMISGSYLVA